MQRPSGGLKSAQPCAVIRLAAIEAIDAFF
jgi:hypothetical protein